MEEGREARRDGGREGGGQQGGRETGREGGTHEGRERRVRMLRISRNNFSRRKIALSKGKISFTQRNTLERYLQKSQLFRYLKHC